MASLPTPEPEALTVAAEELDRIAKDLARLDDRRDELVHRQHALIRDLHEQFPKLSYRQLGMLARMSHTNVSLIFGWTPPADRPKKKRKAKTPAR